MSGHSEDPVAEESERFFTFFNLIYASCCYYRHRNRYHLCSGPLTVRLSFTALGLYVRSLSSSE